MRLTEPQRARYLAKLDEELHKPLYIQRDFACRVTPKGPESGWAWPLALVAPAALMNGLARGGQCTDEICIETS